MDKREQLRAEQVAAENRKKKQLQLLVGGGVVAITLLAIVVALVIGNGKNEITTPQTNEVPLASNSAGIQAYKDAKVEEGAPVVEIFEDYQCPACHFLEVTWGPMFDDLAKEGKIRLQYNTLTFLDAANKRQNSDSSTRAAMAAACASTVNHYEQYHAIAFANQPKNEGDGYSDETLRVEFPKMVKMNDDETKKFQSCYDSKATQKVVQDINATAQKNGVTSTPTIKVNGKVMDPHQLSQKNTKELLLEVIKQNA